MNFKWREFFQVGKQQAYELGAYLRGRYFELINNGTYHTDNIYVQSTDADRTLMSAAHALAGMFPPTNAQIWNPSLLWQAIPIHTIPKEIDHILSMKRPCPLYDQAFSEYEQSPEISLMLKNNRSLIEYLETHLGRKISTICEIKTIYLVLWVEKLKNFPYVPKYLFNSILNIDLLKMSLFSNADVVSRLGQRKYFIQAVIWKSLQNFVLR